MDLERLTPERELEEKEKIYEYIKQCSDKDGLPQFTTSEWAELNNKFLFESEKEKSNYLIRRTMVEYIVNEKPPFPFKEIKKEEVISELLKLCNEVPTRMKPKAVTSKFSYEREFNGIVFDGKVRYNKISDYFQMVNRFECDTKHNVSVLTSWKTGKGLYTILNSFWTMKRIELNKQSWRISFNIAASVASQFRPAIVKNVLDYFNADSYMDMSSGWGDRLAGFYGSNATHYVGFDPSTKTFPVYQEQKKFYDNVLGCDKKVTLINLPSEDVNYDELPEVDLFFSSPPYFMAERYEDNPAQSWVRYKTIDDWKYKFLFVVLEKAWKKIKQGGHMVINISDIYNGKERVYICDEMCDFISKLEDANYLGYYGMKLSLRPNTQEDGIGSEESKIKSGTNESDPHVEPMWVFRKGEERKTRKSVDDLFV
jgi:hypothetical protein